MTNFKKNDFTEFNSTKSTWVADANALHEAASMILSLNKRRRIFNNLIILELVLCICLILTLFFTDISKFWHPSDFHRMLSFLFLAILMVVMREFHNSSRFGLEKYNSVIENLRGLEHLCLLIPLTEGVQAFQPFELTGVEDKIIVILSNITENDKGILTSKEQQYLWYLGFSNSKYSKPFFSSALH